MESVDLDAQTIHRFCIKPGSEPTSAIDSSAIAASTPRPSVVPCSAISCWGGGGPRSANRQIARLKGICTETTVTGRRQEGPDVDTFLADGWCYRSCMLLGHCGGAESKPSAATTAAATFALSSGRGAMPPRARVWDQAIAQHHYQLRFTPLPESAP